MKRLLLSLLLVALPLAPIPLSTGCSTILPGQDKVLVNAERTTAAALETFDAFLLWEYKHREELAPVPEIRITADAIRINGPRWLTTARSLTKTYKAARTATNADNLAMALAVLETATRETQRYLIKGIEK